MVDGLTLTFEQDVDELEWESVSIKLKTNGAVEDEVMREITQLVEAWYLVGAYEGYGGLLHFLSDPYIGAQGDINWIRWRVDMGSTGTSALDVLLASLGRLVKERRWPHAELSVANSAFHILEEDPSADLEDPDLY